MLFNWFIVPLSEWVLFAIFITCDSQFSRESCIVVYSKLKMKWANFGRRLFETSGGPHNLSAVRTTSLKCGPVQTIAAWTPLNSGRLLATGSDSYANPIVFGAVVLQNGGHLKNSMKRFSQNAACQVGTDKKVNSDRHKHCNSQSLPNAILRMGIYL